MCLYMDETLRNHAGINRREVLCYQVQLGAYSELEILAGMREVYKRPIHLTFNSLYYIPEQYPMMKISSEAVWNLTFRVLFWRIRR